jgi:ABC transporter substrate binding protein
MGLHADCTRRVPAHGKIVQDLVRQRPRFAGILPSTELVALTPEVILASGGAVVGPLLQITRTVPIVFTQTPDPVAAGFVASLARPGGNATGFTQVEYGIEESDFAAVHKSDCVTARAW